MTTMRPLIHAIKKTHYYGLDDPTVDVLLVMSLPPQPHPFDFEALMRRSSGNSETLFCVIHDVDCQLPPGPIFVRSELGRGGARYIYFAYFTYFTYVKHNISNLFA